jgi:catechol 2,3-dioxygenase-like lactoylglutathione lyase family enzyme
LVEGVSQVIVEVEDQDRALTFWTEIMEFELVQDGPYGEDGRWIEVRTRDRPPFSCSGLGRATAPGPR